MNDSMETIEYSSESTGPDDSDDELLRTIPVDEADIPEDAIATDKPTEPARRQLFGGVPTDEIEDDKSDHPGYCIVWDNVGKLVTKSDQTSSNRSMYAMFANALMVENRISFRHLEDPDYVRREATTIPISTFLARYLYIQCFIIRGRLRGGSW